MQFLSVLRVCISRVIATRSVEEQKRASVWSLGRNWWSPYNSKTKARACAQANVHTCVRAGKNFLLYKHTAFTCARVPSADVAHSLVPCMLTCACSALSTKSVMQAALTVP